jgi:glutamate/tyrosine decarboxylase-like PLP-dependent enzyme
MRAEKLTLEDLRALVDALTNNTTVTTLDLGSTDPLSIIGEVIKERND